MNEFGAWLKLSELHCPESTPAEPDNAVLNATMLEYNVLPAPGLQSRLSPACTPLTRQDTPGVFVRAGVRGHEGGEHWPASPCNQPA